MCSLCCGQYLLRGVVVLVLRNIFIDTYTQKYVCIPAESRESMYVRGMWCDAMMMMATKTLHNQIIYYYEPNHYWKKRIWRPDFNLKSISCVHTDYYCDDCCNDDMISWWWCGNKKVDKMRSGWQVIPLTPADLLLVTTAQDNLGVRKREIFEPLHVVVVVVVPEMRWDLRHGS